MANIKYALSVLDGFGGGELFIVGDPTTRWGQNVADKLKGQYLGGSLQAAHDAAVSGRGDLILVGPGTYTQAASLAITKNNLAFRAANINPVSPAAIITSSLADTIQIDSNSVSFEGFEIKAGSDTCAQLIDLSDTVVSTGLILRNNVFNPNGKATVKALNNADPTFAGTRMLIENNRFLTGFDTAAIAIGVLGMADSVIRNNVFQITDAKVGISLADTTAFLTGYGYEIVGNNFIGANATADEVSISIAGTEDTTGAGIIRGNFVSMGAAAAITIDKLSKSEINNYYGDAATGGTLVDPGT